MTAGTKITCKVTVLWRTKSSLYLYFLWFIYKTGAKPVFPSKRDKDKPKFNVKGHKETTGYPLPNINCVF